MNVLGRTLGYVVDAWRYATKSNTTKGSGSHQVTASLLMQAARTGTTGGNGDMDYFMRLAVTNPWWFSANRTIANRISDTASFSVERLKDGKWAVEKAHPFLTLLERPNSMMTGGLLLSATAEWMNAAGNGYWFAVTDEPGVGPIRELWPLPADKVFPDPNRLRISPFTGRTVMDYRYQMGGVTWLPGENVIHFRASNLFDYWRGASPLSALQTILPTDLAESSWLGSFFGENNAVPTAVISLPPDTSDADFDIIKRDIVEQFGAQRRAAITRAGDMSVEAIQQTIDEMQVIDGMRFNAEAIRAVLSVPKRDDLTSGQAWLAAEMALMRDAVQPMLNLFAAWMTLKMMPFYEDRPGTLRVVAEDVVPQDSAISVAEYGAYGLDRTLNENRKEQKLEPLKLSGPLAPMQQLFDEVPQRYVELMAPILTQAAQAAQQPPPGAPGALSPGVPGSDSHLLAQMTGQPTDGAGSDDNGLLAQMTGQPPKPQPKQLGMRTAGIAQPGDLVAQMVGGAVKGSDESGYYDPHYGRPGEQGSSTGRQEYAAADAEGRAWKPKRRKDGKDKPKPEPKPEKKGEKDRPKSEDRASVDYSVLNWEKEFYTQKFESCLVVAPDGDIVLAKDGERYEVTFSDDEIAKFKDAILTHNHPSGWDYPLDHPGSSGTSFSIDDLRAFASFKLREMRAVTRGYTAILRWKGSNQFVGGDSRSWVDKFKIAADHADSLTRFEYGKAIRLGEKTIAQANATHAHDVCTRLLNSDEIDPDINRMIDYEWVKHDYN